MIDQRDHRDRCCLCRATSDLKVSTLPGSGFRCSDIVGCRGRVKSIVSAHRGLAEIVG